MKGPRGERRFGRVAAAYGRALTPAGLVRRARIGLDIFRDHQFERYSPLAPLSDAMRDAIGGREVVLPPARYLGGEGNQTVDGLIFIASLARSLEAKTAFEIGTYKGVTTWTIARNVDVGAQVHTLDLPYEANAALELSPLDEANRRVRPEPLFEVLPAGRVEQHWGDSATFDFGPFEDRCDLVYVDGAHTRAYVESDTQNAFRMLSGKGAIVWDDYWRQEPGVRDVLDALEVQGMYRVPGTRLVVHLAQAARDALEAATRERAL